MEKTTTIKSIAVKVKATESKLQLFNILREYTEVASKLGDQLMTFSGRTLCNTEGEPVLSSPELLAKMAKSVEIPLEKFKAYAEGFYSDFTSASMARGYAAFLTQAETKSQNVNAEALRKAGIMPFSYTGPTYDVLAPQGGYKFAVIGSVHNRLSSWIECDATTTKEWKQLKEDLDKARETIIKTYSEKVLTDLDKWLEEVKEFNFNLGLTAGRFLSFFTSSLSASLKAGSPSEFGTWKTKNGKDVEYSCPKEVVDVLFKKYRSLWDSDAPILASRDFSTYVELYNQFQRKREFASYTSIDLIESPVRLLLGTNYVGLKRDGGLVADSTTKTITVTMKYPKSLKGDNSKEWLTVPCTYNRVHKGKRGYFENLVILPEKNEKDNETGNYLFTYSINGKRPRHAIVREPSFRLVVRNQKIDIKNPKITDFDIYLVLALNVEVEPAHAFEPKDLLELRAAMSTAYPEAMDFGRQKSITKERKIDPKAPLLVMGVDLGIRNPFSFSIYEYAKNGKHVELKSGVIAKENPVAIDQYKKFRNCCFNIKKLIASTRYYLQGHKETVDESWLRFINEYLAKQIDGYVPYTTEKYMAWLKKHKDTPINEFKRKENKWIIRDLTFHLRGLLNKMTVERKENNQFSTHFDWISTQEMFIKVMRSYQMVGVDSTVSKPEGRPYRHMRDRIDNLKKDYMKKLAFLLAELAKENGVAIVVTEKLDGLRGNVYNDRDRNQLFNAWPVGQIKHYFTNALANYGVLHSEADERHSSQTVSDTGFWGYRDEDDFNVLWWVDKKGNVYHTHADENAARNLALRYMSRHTRQNSLRLVKVTENTYVPASAFKAADGGKRERGFLSCHFETSRPVFEKKGEFLVPSNKTFKEISKSVKNKTPEKMPWFFVDNTFKKLMDKDHRDLLEQQIKEMPKPKL